MFRNVLYLALLAVVVSACGAKTEAPEANPLPHDTIKGPGLFSGESGEDILAAFRPKNSDEMGGLAVNGYLWRSALETISFMPITQADSAGGVIVTDWTMSPSNKDERVKVTVLIKGRQLRGDAVQVSVFKQVRKGQEWQDTAVADTTARQLEDTILTKARALRVRDKAGN